MAAILGKILSGEVTLQDLDFPLKVDGKEDVKEENKKLKKQTIAELAPFLLNYLREKTSHHLTPRQNATSTPKKTPILQSKGVKSTNDQSCINKNSSKGTLFLSQKTPSPSPMTPLSQSRREKLQEHHASPCSSPRLRKKSPKVQGNDRYQPKLNIDDPDDFPAMGTSSKKVTPSRRITPTQLKSDGRKGKWSPAFSSSSLTLESNGSPASLQEERKMLKLMKAKKQNKGDSPWGNRTSPSPQAGVRSPPLHVLGDFIVTPPKQTVVTSASQHKHSTANSLLSTPSPYKDHNGNNSLDISATSDSDFQHSEEEALKDKTQFIQVDKEKVSFHDKLDALAKIYSKCIMGNLVPNVIAEVYFVVQLLTARGIALALKPTQEDNVDDQNILDSIHNCTYFSVAVLHNIRRLIFLLDKDTLRLLADNPRIADFSPGLKETFLEKYKSHSAVKVSEQSFIKSPLGGVPFSVERDNKQNFPSDRAFHNFRKQRDVFYELVREWEDCNSVAGWNIEEHMGDRIRALVNQKPQLANYSHFARLFKSQLLQMCEEERTGSDFRNSSMLSNLQKSNPEKFQRLQERFVTPSSSGGTYLSPSFSNVQEFFKGFIQSASCYSFNQHLMDVLIVTITEVNGKVFPLLDSENESGNDSSIQSQELKQEFTCCLMKIRILAKFLGFLLFQPYYGTETTSQVVVAETLKIRNKIPVYFDVLSYLKKASCRGRLVLTVPWAVEYLSMMDPLAPLLDYFSMVLRWLSRKYRELAECSLQELNHSKLLLVSCLGWLFEIPVIPAPFFFKSLAEEIVSADSELPLRNSGSQITLDSSGLVDQTSLYSCCPYLGEIRSVLVEAAAGLSGRTGPVKKITPVSAGEPTRISSSHKQLQLQLEENFFRIQPDFVKRLSDFTVERLCSNIISSLKGSVVPSLLETGVQRIQQFMNSELSNNGNTDQAKEKCRPQVLKIIHSVTDNGVKKAVEIVESSKKKCVNAFESLCPEEMDPKVVMTAANITKRLVKEKTMDWVNTTFPNIMEEELFVQFNKIANSILHSKSKEQENVVEARSRENSEVAPDKESELKAKSSPPSVPSAEDKIPFMKVKALQVVLSEQSTLLSTQSSKEITHGLIEAISAVESIVKDEARPQMKEMALIGQITVELAFILVCRTAHEVKLTTMNCTKDRYEIIDKLAKLWTLLKDKHLPVPFDRLLSMAHVNLVMSMEKKQVVWESFQMLFLILIRHRLVSVYEVEQWYIGALGRVRDEENAVEVGKACCSLVSTYQEMKNKLDSSDNGLSKATHPADFAVLISVLKQRFPHNISLLIELTDYINNSAGHMVISTDSAYKNTQ
ncbi:codanin-1-like [Porites lutea]|uniref:codanin-1-like n=1 Tax=Porites lutea TaxID=51062 RepID=UPI003CC51B4C